MGNRHWGVVAGALGLAASAVAWGMDHTGWSKDKSGDNVTVYVQPAPGYSLKAFRAVTTVPVPMDAVNALIADAPAFSQWYSDCRSNKIIKTISSKEYVTYFVNDSPFPVMDRDSLIHTTVSQDPATRAVTFAMKGAPTLIPEKDDYVRVPKLEGYWRVTPIGASETEVVLELRSDTGGSVPSFLANQQVTVGPFKTFQKLRAMVQKPRYLKASVDYETVTVTYGK
jgi:hypothetical protein